MEEKNININDERDVRLNKLQTLIKEGINPYPARVHRTHTLKEALEEKEGQEMTVTGRLMTKRDMGKLTFAHLQDGTGRMQIALKKDEIDEAAYKHFLKKIDSGDIIEVTGEKFITHKKEPSVLVRSFTLLSKALLPLPDKFHGLNDEETRYRKRYLDFLINEGQKEKIIVRSRILKYMRDYLDNAGFIEVETPSLEVVASGALAQTFDTHLNAFDLPVHMRICMGELWQKRLLIGGFEKTYEIGRAYRNEGVDHSHNPEFTMMEFYWAYADINDNIKLHEEMMPFIVEKSVGTLKIENDGDIINFTTPYPRITFHDAVLEHSGIDINNYDDATSLGKAMKEKGYDVEKGAERGKLLDNLYKQSTRLHIIQPTFVLNYPVELKPLAKKAEDPRYTEMFQLVIKGFELSNSYTELNDPIDQRERFEEQARLAEAGEEEVMGYDHDYVEALEYGMPPATGTGIGIDRLAALITNSHTLREVTAFPLMKPEQGSTSQKKKTTTPKKEDSAPRTVNELPMSRDEAWELVLKHNSATPDLQHYRESEVILRALAKRLGRDVEYWGMLGMLHDIDWGLTKEEPKTHLTKMPAILREAGFNDQFIEDVLSHGYGCGCADLDNMTRDCEIQYALACGETVTGLVYAAARMRPEKIASLELRSLKKKFKNKKFAEKVNRDVIRECEKLGIELDEFLQLAIDAMKEIAEEIDLA